MSLFGVRNTALKRVLTSNVVSDCSKGRFVEKIVGLAVLLNDGEANVFVVGEADGHLVDVSVKVPVITVTQEVVGIDAWKCQLLRNQQIFIIKVCLLTTGAMVKLIDEIGRVWKSVAEVLSSDSKSFPKPLIDSWTGRTVFVTRTIIDKSSFIEGATVVKGSGVVVASKDSINTDAVV